MIRAFPRFPRDAIKPFLGDMFTVVVDSKQVVIITPVIPASALEPLGATPSHLVFFQKVVVAVVRAKHHTAVFKKAVPGVAAVVTYVKAILGILVFHPKVVILGVTPLPPPVHDLHPQRVEVLVSQVMQIIVAHPVLGVYT